MMVLQVMFTEDEIRKFFENNGYKCEMRDYGEWRKTTHRDSDWVEIPRLSVVFKSGTHTRADKLFEKIITHRIKRQMTPTNLETQRLIEIIHNNNLKAD